jgi:hypothetical protein
MSVQGPPAGPKAHFLFIPSELRLQIYNLLLDGDLVGPFNIKSEDPDRYRIRSTPPRRSRYYVSAAGLQRQVRATTYVLDTDIDLFPSILAVSHQLNTEASAVLYRRREFKFGPDIDAIEPFLQDIGPSNRSLIQEVSLTKRPSVYSRDFERSVWLNACKYMADNLCLLKLDLVVIGGQPPSNWKGDVKEYSASDFRALVSVGFQPLEWVESLRLVKTADLNIVPVIENCPVPRSSALVFFAVFSASIDKGFAEYLTSEMIRT